MARIAIILAAGESTRMKTQLPKVLHEVCGRPMLAFVLDACRRASIDKMYVVIGYGKEQVIEKFKDADDVCWVEQAEQKGTAHAVMCCKEQLADFNGQVLILCGDGPLLRIETLNELIEKHKAEKSAVTLATMVLDEPFGYGRIVRDEQGNIQEIIEERDCNEQQRAIKEVNPSYYCFEKDVLFDVLEKVKPDNVKNEYYLTDAVRLILAAGRKACAIQAVNPQDALSVNSRQQLAKVNEVMQKRIQEKLMSQGVTIVSPVNTWIDAQARIGEDTIIEPFTYIRGEVEIGRNCRVGPFVYLTEGTVLPDNIILGDSAPAAGGAVEENTTQTGKVR
jgi:bifunctional UDP-N-acetylglucosamine pyrophosphorylase/glucosamine-1-phosphate N-acetyltransferase